MIKLFRARSDRKSKIKEQKPQTSVLLYIKNPALHRACIGILLSAIIALLIPSQLTVTRYNYQLGDISRDNIRAAEDFSVEDTLTTEKAKQEKRAAVLSVYDFNSKADEDIEKRVTTAFSLMRDALAKTKKPEPANDRLQQEFESILRVRLADNDFAAIQKKKFKKSLEDNLLELVLPFAQREVVVAKEDQLFKEWGRKVLLRDINTKEEMVLEDYSRLIAVKDLQLLIRRESRKVLQRLQEPERSALLFIATKLIEPNVTFNKQETENRRNAADAGVSPVSIKVKKGEIIIREGERINESALAKLSGLKKRTEYSNITWTLIGYFIVTFILLYFVYQLTISNLKARSVAFRDFVFLCILLGLFTLLLKLSIVSGRAFYSNSSLIPLNAYFYAIPFALVAIIVSVVLNTQLAAVASIVIAICSGLLIDNQVAFIIYPFVSCLLAAREVSECRERKTLIKAGLKVGLCNTIIIVAFSILRGSLLTAETVISIGLGMSGGLLSGILATGIIPIIEIIFNYTTNIKLLELADLNQPALRELIISAPGTYHHSIIVGSLVEAAAEVTQANPLLSRVSAYYHDIGKIKKPLYFVENQKGGENKHDKLLPSMSSLILISHVKDGVEIAKRNRLGKSIQDIISQHHGTSINYFYQKAKELNVGSEHTVSEKDFRYPGPKPQTKEAGLVMLADAVEAASKTLTDPTPARIQGMVNRIITNIFTDGQLDECELTLKDIHLIAQSFIRILNGIFHARVEYPEKIEKEANGTAKSPSPDQKPASTDSERPAGDTTNGQKYPGRLGVIKSGDKHSALG